ncbi:DNA-directed RNA polymerases I and III subunit RPAC1 [Gonapodya sp. JEL0774]|nr:DNA-directed RNA polymerases I and III subunit RPAC1 [Gonapodya sp. JEL0774]
MPVHTVYSEQGAEFHESGHESSDGFKHLTKERNQGECDLGQLTDTGKRQLLSVGRYLRDVYVTRLGFLPEKFEDPHILHVASSDIARTIESAQYLVSKADQEHSDVASPHILTLVTHSSCPHPTDLFVLPTSHQGQIAGLYPSAHRSPNANFRLHIRPHTSEFHYPNTTNCSLLNNLVEDFKAAQLPRVSPRLREIERQYPMFLPQGSPIAYDGVKPISHLDAYDVSTCMLAEGAGPLAGMTEKSTKALGDEYAQMFYEPFGFSEQVQRLAMGRLIDRIAGRMERKVKNTAATGRESAKLAVWSGHDTTLGPLLFALKAWDGKWPEFANHIVLELFEETNQTTSQSPSWMSAFFQTPTPRHYVRLLHNKRPLNLPYCAAPPQHHPSDPATCTLEAFLEGVKGVRITDAAWTKECEQFVCGVESAESGSAIFSSVQTVILSSDLHLSLSHLEFKYEPPPLRATSTEFPGSYAGEDLSWSLDAFKEGFHFEITYISPDQMTMEFDMVGIDAAFANAFRRIMIAEVPTMAIEQVFISNNTSIMHDEILAQRLGMLPIRANPAKFHYKVPGDIPSDQNTLVFRLNVKCTAASNPPKDAVVPEDLYVNSSVYSSQLKWEPQGDQARELGENGVGMVHDDILLVKMRPGQMIQLECHAEKGQGKDHAKYSPVATASYRLLPSITITQPITGDLADKFVSCFPEGVAEVYVDPATGLRTARVVNPRKDTVSREVLRHPELEEKVVLGRMRDHFIFTVESAGAVTAPVLLTEAIKILRKKCETAKEKLGEWRMGTGGR